MGKEKIVDLYQQCGYKDLETKLHEDGFYYQQLEDGRISVTGFEIQKYLKKTNIIMEGKEYDSINDKDYPIYIDFTDYIKRGNSFNRIDMFGETHIVTKEVLLKFIEDNYNY